MTILAEKIISTLQQFSGLTDRELTNKILGKNSLQQPVNSVCRLLAQRKVVNRIHRDDGKIGNYLLDTAPLRIQPNSPNAAFDVHSEDAVKQHIANWLAADGWNYDVKWGKTRGIDIHASKGNARWIIEVKGIGSYPSMRVNYFLGALAELLQRMDDPKGVMAEYSQNRTLRTRI
ncbi:MarR family transcriptional regulator [Ktedonosporobacter rubrisoli]|uniref:MarR family transcriptional regulator n=1 Tax=Ktedonosporobacter rubrisoli TaxID=2509675 RepID=A0A4V0YY67_KTERU|nr:MarR family transcriptional regulator [Ktedonosporobacter rubrisoli]QBD75161.1 MarR family transcriptional regulator [Ktedonosporobacter rubrisoli]